MGILQLIVRDETVGGEVKQEFNLNFESPNVSAEDIIRERVIQEVDAYNRKVEKRFNGLVQPTETEETLNGYRFKKRRKVNAAKQIATALKAFQGNGFFMLIDNRQIENLDEIIELKPNMAVSFIKLTPLVGG